MPNLVKLESSDGSPIFINPKGVLVVYKHRDFTVIEFVEGLNRPIKVKNGLEEVVQLLAPIKTKANNCSPGTMPSWIGVPLGGVIYTSGNGHNV